MATNKTTKKSERANAPAHNEVKEEQKVSMTEVETSVDKIDKIVDRVEQLATKVAETEKPARKHSKADKHDSNELIACRSMIYGELFLQGPKTGMIYSWSNVGDIREVEYQDLLSWKVLRAHPLFDPLIVIEDDEICEEWNVELEPIYSKIKAIDIEEMFKLPVNVFKDRLSKLPNSVRETVQNTAFAMIQDNRLYDIRIVKAIDEILGTELLMMI